MTKLTLNRAWVILLAIDNFQLQCAASQRAAVHDQHAVAVETQASYSADFVSIFNQLLVLDLCCQSWIRQNMGRAAGVCGYATLLHSMRVAPSLFLSHEMFAGQQGTEETSQPASVATHGITQGKHVPDMQITSVFQAWPDLSA